MGDGREEVWHSPVAGQLFNTYVYTKVPQSSRLDLRVPIYSRLYKVYMYMYGQPSSTLRSRSSDMPR